MKLRGEKARVRSSDSRAGGRAREREGRELDAPERALRVGLELRLDHADDDLVRHEAALVHDLLGLLAEVGAALDLVAQHVARREVAHVVRLLDLGRLGALACET